jgi:tripartite-type tricarboxylate transporter receptor subunit TctC
LKKNKKIFLFVTAVICIFLVTVLLIRLKDNSSADLSEDVTAFYKGNSIRFIVPSSPGGGFDEYTRMLVPYLEKYSGATVKVINSPGAGGMLAANELFRSPRDGLTIGMMNGLAMVTNRLVGIEGANYIIKEFEYLGRVVDDRRVLSIAIDNKIQAIDDVWNSDDIIKLGATGLGGSAYVDGVISKEAFKMNVQIIHGFDSSSAVRQSLLRGNIDGAWGSYGSAEDGVEAGLERIILQSGRQRLKEISDVPAIFEFIDRTEDPVRTEKILSAWDALISVGRPVATAPGTQENRVAFLRDVFAKAMNDSEFIQRAAQVGREINFASSDEMMEIIISATQMEPDIEALFTRAVRGEL